MKKVWCHGPPADVRTVFGFQKLKNTSRPFPKYATTHSGLQVLEPHCEWFQSDSQNHQKLVSTVLFSAPKKLAVSESCGAVMSRVRKAGNCSPEPPAAAAISIETNKTIQRRESQFDAWDRTNNKVEKFKRPYGGCKTDDK